MPNTIINKATVHSLPHDKLWTQAFMSVMHPIINRQKHRDIVSATTPKECTICNGRRNKVTLVSVSKLHYIDPHVIVLAFPSCSKESCDEEILSQINLMITLKTAQDMFDADAFGRGGKPVMVCPICKKEEKTLKCGRCGKAYYCGKKHQRLDWPNHKRFCGERNVLE